MHLGRNFVILIIGAVLIFLANVSVAQSVNSRLVPYVRNFSKAEYGAANQNWDVVQSPDGMMYFGNSDGLLEYDGATWKMYPLPDGQIVRSVAVDSLGRIFVGAHEEFGFWEYDNKGELTYHSLVSLADSVQIRNQDIWKICIQGNRVYFQSFAGIFCYDQEKILEIKAPANVFSMFQVGQRIFVSLFEYGLYELKGTSLNQMKGTHVLASENISVVLPWDDNNLLVGTVLGGLFRYDGQRMIPWETEGDNFFKAYQLNKGSSVVLEGERYYALGTITEGVVILDQQGKLNTHLNKASGLQNNTVLGLCVGRDNNLWVSLDNGIDYVQLNSSFRYFSDRTGGIGTVYSAAVYSGYLYLGTNHGLFRAPWDGNNFRLKGSLKFVEMTQGQVWDLRVIDNVLFCGHNEGTFRITPKGVDKISFVSGGWVLKRVPGNPDMLLQGTYIGLVVYTKQNGIWQYSHMLKGYYEPTKYLEFDHKGNIWASHAYKGLFKLRTDKGLENVEKMNTFFKKDGLPSDYNVNVFKVDNQVVFTSGERLFTFDYVANNVADYQSLNDQLKGFGNATKIIPVGGNSYWFFHEGKVGLVSFDQGSVSGVNTSVFGSLRSGMLSGYENIVGIGHDRSLICLDDGFAIFSLQHQESLIPINKQNVLLRRVSCGTSTSKYQDAIEIGSNPEIEFSGNNLTFEFALPAYHYSQPLYQWKLEGYDVLWSDSSPLSWTRYNKLPYGEYAFLVRATDGHGGYTDITRFTFSILPPWYLSGFAKGIYFLLLLGLVIFLRVIYFLKLDKQKKKYYLKLQSENEERIMKLKNDHLREEIENKSKDLANYTMVVTKKNDLLNQLKEQLIKLETYVVSAAAKKRLLSINRLIEGGFTNEEEWKIFNENFDKANDVFFVNIKQAYPDLTPHDLRFCAFLRMNMSSKEIASLLNMSPRSVEVKRYRLRKKLNLEHQENLVEFLMEIANKR